MTGTDHTRRATFGQVFAVPEFRVLFGSFALLVAGDTVKMLAFAALVYGRTGSAGLSALAYMSGFLPYVLGGTFLLSLADRMRPRRLMIAGELVRVAVCLALASGGMPVWAMLLLVVVTGTLNPVFGAARTATLPELLPGDSYVLGRSVLTITSAGAQIGGLAAGGAVLSLAGPGGALLITAALSAAGAVLLRLGLPDHPPRAAVPTAVPSSPSRAETAASGTGSVLDRPSAESTEISGGGAEVGGGGAETGRGRHGAGHAGAQTGRGRHGAGHARRDLGAAGGNAVRASLRVNRRLLADRRVRALMLCNWIPVMFVAGAEALVVPYLNERGAPSQAGFVLAAFAVGMALGDLVVGRFAAPAMRERLSFPLAVASGVPLAAFAARPSLPWCLALGVLTGACLAYNLGLQRRFVDAAPPDALGQAFGLFTSGQMTTQGLGAALAGAIASLLPAHLAIAVIGGAAVLAALALARHLRPERAEPAEPAEPGQPVEPSGPGRTAVSSRPARSDQPADAAPPVQAGEGGAAVIEVGRG
ncbi:MFS transporter [Sphaerisporangium sp. NPDC005288]|uniref:MFS transporter n=1 Tax=Sphaerisporangium sp. NPDC005288 TaxID=3155114 RepID=UPI0033A0FF7A